MSNPCPRKVESIVIPFDYPIDAIKRLPEPERPPVFDYFDLYKLRRSRYPVDAIQEKQLSTLLWYSVKAHHVFHQENGYTLSLRPSASAGARHPIDLLIFSPSREAEPYYYNPFEHTLNRLTVSGPALRSFLDHIEENTVIGNATLVWFVAHTERTSAKYDHAQSLIWRDAGALLHCIQCSATALQLSSCPLGTLAEPYFDPIFSRPNVLSAGGILIGQ